MNGAGLDVRQAAVTVGGKTRICITTLDAEAGAIVLAAVTNTSLDASAPVVLLGVPEDADCADVGAGDVLLAVGDGFKALIVDQSVAFGALLANRGASIGTVRVTVGDAGGGRTVVLAAKVEALGALDAVTFVVDGGAVFDGAKSAGLSIVVVKVVRVAAGAVGVVVPLEAAALG